MTDLDPMWDLTPRLTLVALNTYIREVSWNCHIASGAVDDMVQAYGRHDLSSFFVGVQVLLTAGASISKLMWPTVPTKNPDAQAMRRKERGERIRKELSIADVSPLKNRAMRNAFEHIDERLDLMFDQIATGRAGPLVTNVALGQEQFLRADNPQYIRVYIEDRDVINILGTQLVINQYREAVDELRAQCDEWLAEHPSHTPVP